MILALIAVAFSALICRVVYLETYGRELTIRSAERQQHMSQVLPARRGNIWDASGNVLAGTVQVQEAYIDPEFMLAQIRKNAEEKNLNVVDETTHAIQKLAAALDEDDNKLLNLIDEKSDSRFVRLPGKLDDQTIAALQNLDLPGVGIMPVDERYYPMGTLAAHVLGSVGFDSHGLDGVELKFDKLLSGKDGYQRSLKDAQRRGIATAEEDYVAPEHGQHLVLTIDTNIQLIAEQELAATCKLYRAKHGEVVVMNPANGEVLALANYPTYDPNDANNVPAENRLNNAIVVPYEPGSTNKPVLVGFALANGIAKPEDIFHLNGSRWRTPYGRVVSDVHGYSQLSLWDVLVKSSNIGMSMLAERMGNPLLYKALKAFQMGERTGIELPGEDPGLVNPLRKWSHFSTESIAQGYELMVTPLQLARAMCAYANGGHLVQPHVIRGTLGTNGTVAGRYPQVITAQLPRILPESAANQVRRILADVPVRGTGTKARSAAWNLFGKTGTAHISRNGVYNETAYTSSFVGGGPYENPRLVVAFIIHEPDRSIEYYGGAVSGPGARNVLERSLAYLAVPSSPDLPVPPPQVAGTLYNYNPKLYQLPVNNPTLSRRIQTADISD